MFKLKIPPDFGEEPYSISALAIADSIAYLLHTFATEAVEGSSIFLFFMACCSWLTVGVACKLILKYGFN